MQRMTLQTLCDNLSDVLVPAITLLRIQMSALDIPCVFLISKDRRALCGTHREGKFDEGYRLYTCGSHMWVTACRSWPRPRCMCRTGSNAAAFMNECLDKVYAPAAGRSHDGLASDQPNVAGRDVI